jgi:prepilin signal peptidase PulO-like enzyme (type II secretory pathway)
VAQHPVIMMIVLFGTGATVGGLLNLAICRLAWLKRTYSPWYVPRGDDDTTPWDARDDAPRRSIASRPRPGWSDRVPIFGWLSWRRAEVVYPRGFWWRPLAIELICGAAFAGLYWWEVLQTALLPNPAATAGAAASVDVVTLCAIHLLLFALMVVATLIDIDDRIIPDTITVPGTLAGWGAAIVLYGVQLPVVGGGGTTVGLTLASPLAWPGQLDRGESLLGLAVGLGVVALWCFALLPRRWYARHGAARALGIIWARIVRYSYCWCVIALGAVAAVVVTAVWYGGGPRWESLCSALVGTAVGGGLIWAVRLNGAVTLGREAMGFGDVTLMGMIGAFLGWQPCLMIFFLAPFFGLLVGLLQWIGHGESEIPYGPYLCLATLAVIVRWRDLWNWGEGIFAISWLVPTVLVLGLVLMAIMLLAMRMLRRGDG